MKKILLLAAACLAVAARCAMGAEPWLQRETEPVLDRGATIMEVTPILWKGRPLLVGAVRPFASSHEPEDLKLRVLDLESGQTLAEFGTGASLSCACVEKRGDEEILHVFAARQPEGEPWFRDIVRFETRDLQTWTERPAIQADDENLLNSSVCRDGDGWLMAYESNKPVGFCFKFARSKDLDAWEKVPDAYYAGPDGKTYSACPVIRRSGDCYYVVYLRADGKGGHESAAIRSKDLRTWEESRATRSLRRPTEKGPTIRTSIFSSSTARRSSSTRPAISRRGPTSDAPSLTVPRARSGKKRLKRPKSGPSARTSSRATLNRA